MTNTKKAAVFVSAFLSTLLLMPVFSYIFVTLIGGSNNTIGLVFYPVLLTFILFSFAFMQSFFRYLFIRKTLTNSFVLLTVKPISFSLKEKMWFYIFASLIYFIPLLKSLSFGYSTFLRIALFLATLLIIEITLRMSSNRMKIHFLRNGIIVTGFDLRIDIPLNQSFVTQNDSGYYDYNDIDSYFPFPEHMDLFLIGEQGKLTFQIDEETRRQVIGILMLNKVAIKKFS